MNEQKREQLIQEFVEILEEHGEDWDNLDLLWDLLNKRPDLILRRISGSYIGERSSIDYQDDHNAQLVISAPIDTGMARNWDGSGCEGKLYGRTCIQTIYVNKDHKRFENRY